MGLGQVWRRLPAPLRLWALPAIIVLLSLLFESLADAGRVALRFDRAGIEAGQLWRLLTGHLVHLGWSHLALNVLGLVLVWLLCGRALTLVAWCLVLVTVVAGVDAGLWWRDPGLEWYVGLSGVLHGLLAAGIVTLVFGGSMEMLLLGLIFVGKLAWEQVQGPLPGSEGLAGAAVVVNAHLYGAVAGVLAGVVAAAGRDRPI